MALTISRLRDLKEDGYKLHAACSNYFVCSHSQKLDLDALIERFGPDFNHQEGKEEIVRRLVCRKCGKRRPEIQLLPPTPGEKY